MAELGCLKDGHFQNLQVESTTIFENTASITISGADDTITIPGTLKYQNAELPLITMMGLNPTWAFNFGDPSVATSATAAGALATIITPAGTLYNLSKCLENIAAQTEVVSVVQGTALFGVTTVIGTDAAIPAAGATSVIIPDNLHITRITGNVGTSLVLSASTFNYLINERALAIFKGGNVFAASQVLTLTTHTNAELNAQGCEVVVSGEGNDIMIRAIAPSDGDSTIILTASSTETTILEGSYIYIMAGSSADQVNYKICLRTTGGTIAVTYG